MEEKNKKEEKMELLGKIIIEGSIKVITGLRIGGLTTGLKIGGVDLNVVKTPDDVPYIPGSSLKGKLRSLMEYKLGKVEGAEVHRCTDEENYKKCPICRIWGISPTEIKSEDFPVHTRAIFRDVFLNKEAFKENVGIEEEEWTEVKVENVIDRIKGSAKDPRHIERVPPGAEFSPMEIIYNVFEDEDKDFLRYLFEAMELLEHDYLGGMGSRGYGKIKFQKLKIYWNKKEDYEKGELNKNLIYEANEVSDILKNFEKIKEKIQ